MTTRRNHQSPTDVVTSQTAELQTNQAQPDDAGTADSSASDVGSDASTNAAEPVAEANDDEAVLSFKSAVGAPPSEQPRPLPEYPEDIAGAEPVKGPDIDIEKLARGWQVGRAKLRWIANCLNEPFADSRLSGTPLPLSRDMPTLHSLEVGQCVWAVVVGVADFGAFVELSPDCSGLVHISRLSANFVEDPHQAVQVGDLLLTWVVSKDEKKNRVALTALSPAQRALAEAAAQHRREDRQPPRRSQSGQPHGQASGQARGDRQTGGVRQGQGQGQAAGATGERGRGQRGGQRSGAGRSGGGVPRLARTRTWQCTADGQDRGRYEQETQSPDHRGHEGRRGPIGTRSRTYCNSTRRNEPTSHRQAARLRRSPTTQAVAPSGQPASDPSSAAEESTNKNANSGSETNEPKSNPSQADSPNANVAEDS